MARARQRSGPAGVLVVDKAAGMTSFGVVARARQALGERRIGHAGTLDPAAVGVLPLLVGEATKLMPYLVDQDKEYVATIRLGITTDTHDLEGRVVATAPVPALSRESTGARLSPLRRVASARSRPCIPRCTTRGAACTSWLGRAWRSPARRAR